ncbi:hypothetical protein [Devosia epidermidihirudinis]|nr:hypothetical protein [Devosia epidermidihirudinis]
MKYDRQFAHANVLPDAPLAMPKQQLEPSRRSLFGALRDVFLVFSSR